MALPKVVILSSNVLTDRMMLYNEFLQVLSKKAEIIIWPVAWTEHAYQDLSVDNVKVEAFPKVSEMKFRLALLRRLNDYVWDAKNINKTRRLFWKYSRDNVKSYEYLFLTAVFLINIFGLANWVERISRKFYINENRSPEAYNRLKIIKPDLLVMTSPLLTTSEPGIVNSAIQLKIPVMAFISSWDNLSTKSRFMFDFDGYILWSTQMKKDLDIFYPYARKKPYYIVGAPQFDVFKNPEYYITKEEFCKQYDFDPLKPIVLYTLGSPNMYNELPGAIEFVKRAAKNEMVDIQIIVRPHPAKFNDPGLVEIPKLYSKVVIQKDSNPKDSKVVFTHDKSKIIEWVNSFKYSDIVIHISSSTAIDGAIFDKGIINLDFDPSGIKSKMAWHGTHTIHHYKPVVDLGGMLTASNVDEMIEAVNKYIQNPELSKAERKRMVDFTCEYTDGNCGERYANAIIDFLSKENITKVL